MKANIDQKMPVNSGLISDKETIVEQYKNLAYVYSKFPNFTSETQAKLGLTPLIDKSLVLFEKFGFVESDIVAEFGSTDAPGVLLLGMSVMMLNEIDGRTLSPRSVSHCALEALGVDRIVDWAKGKYLSSAAARKVLIKLLGKTAARLGLGYVGAAWAIYQFMECMGVFQVANHVKFVPAGTYDYALYLSDTNPFGYTPNIENLEGVTDIVKILYNVEKEAYYELDNQILSSNVEVIGRFLKSRAEKDNNGNLIEINSNDFIELSSKEYDLLEKHFLYIGYVQDGIYHNAD